MRRISSLLLIPALLCMQIPAQAAFWDVPASSVNFDAFAYLEQHNIIQGLPDGSGKPDQLLTRVEALKTILRSRERFAPQIVWLTENLPEIALFQDLDQHQWYAPYVEVAFLRGIVTGYQDSTFRPGNPVTTEEAIVMLQRTYGTHENAGTYRTSSDLTNTPGQWYSDALSEAIDRNIVRRGSKLQVGKPITRGQFFSLLQRLHSITEQHRYAYEDPEPIAVAPAPIAVTPGGGSGPIITNNAANSSLQSASLQYASDKTFAITIPKLNIIDLAVIHPDNPFDPKAILEPLKYGVGHLFSYPGSDGKTMIYGHSSSYAWDVSDFTKIFRTINKLEPGDRVYITYEGTLHVYEVSHNSIIKASDTSPFDDDGIEEVILYTCWPPDNITHRYLQHLRPIETVAIANYPMVQ